IKPSAQPTATDKVTPVNNFLHSLFSLVDVFFNPKLVSPQSNTYPYRAYIENTLNYESTAKNTHLTAGLYYQQSPCALNNISKSIASGNAGLSASSMKDGRILDFSGPLRCDVFNQEKYLLNGVDMHLRLDSSKDNFCLMQSGTGYYKVHITEATLFVRKV
ncbi:uncharacterized protein F54H12.2-like, partial [Cephus cinctus]|uniref:Uncharacterized protein F54H12.2-like n=1 Tax=Cephus cinctus TaxID=211228 RepID=A0AAJ7CGP9_CEPCN